MAKAIAATTRVSFPVKSPRGWWRHLICIETVLVGLGSIAKLLRGIHTGAIFNGYGSAILGFCFCGQMALYLGHSGRQILGRYVFTEKKLLAAWTTFFGRGLNLTDIATAVPFAQAPSRTWRWLGKSAPTVTVLLKHRRFLIGPRRASLWVPEEDIDAFLAEMRSRVGAAQEVGAA